MKQSLVIAILLLGCTKMFAQPAVQIEDLEKFRARVAVECSTWSSAEQTAWLAAIDSIRGLHGVVLDVSGIAKSAERVIPYLLGAFLDAPLVRYGDDHVEDKSLHPTHNEPYLSPALLVHGEEYDPEIVTAIQLFTKRDFTDAVRKSQLSEGDDVKLLRFLIRSFELQRQERMEMLFEGN